MRALALILLAWAAPAAAAPVVSAGPDAVSVTIYRDPNRPADRAMERDDLGGFALVTETRTIDLPAGPAELRFEDVVGGILPQSVIVKGLPGGTVEKNRDARLLSPGLLLDAHLGARVHLVRTNPGNGAVSEEDAIVRATNDGVVIESKAGIEALGCSGLPERLTYDAVPAGLSAHPALSVTTVNPSAGRVTVTLSYLATEFDWQANYIATINPDGRTLDLLGWMTLANGNRESLPDATLLAVAGRLNTGDMQASPAQSAAIVLRCWPRGTMAPLQVLPVIAGAPPPPPPPPPPPAPMAIMVSAMRKEAVLEALGDLKLYRVPDAVTVAAAATKQVGLLHADGVRFQRIYTLTIAADETIDAGASRPLAVVLRTRNDAASGLGKPLPLGRVALFERGEGGTLLVAESGVRDTATGEEWEIPAGESAQVRLTISDTGAGRRTLSISNADDHPVDAEIAIRLPDGQRLSGVHLGSKNGQALWQAQVPANGTASISYRVRAPR